MLYLISFVFVLYAVVLLVLSRGWRRALTLRNDNSGINHTISVVVPVRNEEHTITSLLDDLTAQTFPYMDIIVVDDHSTDHTRDMVSQYIAQTHNVKLMLSKGTGKKQALTSGISSAQGSIIVTTDADCRVGTQWVESINSKFNNATIHFAFGLVRMDSSTFFDRIQAIEFASVLGTGVAAFGLGRPMFCNGANLAFRKSSFISVGGYEGNFEIASGDDEFLMRKMLTSWPDGIALLDPTETMVTTRANPTLASLFNQRIRWAGKWNFATLSSRVVAVAVMLVHMIFLASLILGLVGSHLAFILSIWAVKVVAEIYFLSQVCRILKVRLTPASFATLQLTYSLYVVSIGILSNFTSFRWKDRTILPPVTNR